MLFYLTCVAHFRFELLVQIPQVDMKVLYSGTAADVPADCVWLVPGVSVGNAGQQCIDLLLQTLQASKSEQCPVQEVGVVVSQHVRSIASSSVFDEEAGKVHTEMTLYHVPAASVIILQQRSRCHEGFEEAWAAELADFAAAAGSKGIVVLAGAQAFMDGDAAISQAKGPEVRPLLFQCSEASSSPASASGSGSEPASANDVLLVAGKKVFGDAFSAISVNTDVTSADASFATIKAVVARAFEQLQGCGLAARFARRGVAVGLPVLVVPITLNEGLNAPEALILAHVSQVLLGLVTDASGAAVPPPQVSWKEPPSWKMPEGPAPPPMFFLGSK